jgi:indole-3-glycerol phosphate synthase
MDILKEIIAKKAERVAEAKARVPLDRLRETASAVRCAAASHALFQSLSAESTINVIAEFKRRSPSKGSIRANADPAAIAMAYQQGGAVAMSVLTEEDHFSGSFGDFATVRQTTTMPLLRKDFIFDVYQVYETAAAGADALLLIVAALTDTQLSDLRSVTEDEFGLDALVEVHDSNELKRALAAGARLIGVNNRDLRSFAVSLETSMMLAREAPSDVLLISESGLHSHDDLLRLREAGYQGFLIGESLMRAADPAAALKTLIGE